jgi:hypothetical protein
VVYEFVVIGEPGDEDKPLEIRSISTDAQTRGVSTPAA